MGTKTRGAVWSAQRMLDRRQFLKTGTIAVAGLAAGVACSTAPASAPTPTAAAASGGPAATPTAAAKAPRYGGTFSYPWSLEAPHLDVHQTGTALLHHWGPGVAYSRLLGYKAGPGVTPGSVIVRGDLAESWDQPDETTYVFKLRRGVKWHNIPPVNGRELVADDIVYSYQRILDLKTNAGFLGAISKFEAPDPSTVRITVQRPDIDYLATLAGGWNKIVAREAVDANGDLKNGPTIGTGPFILEKWEANSITTLRKNPDYFLKGLPYIDRLEFPRIKDDQTRFAAFRTKQVSHAGTSLTPKDVEMLKAQVPDAQLLRYRSTAPDIEIGMNKRNGPTADKRVRMAISKALNRQEIIDAALQGGGYLFGHFYVPGPDYVLPESELKQAYTRDLAAAKKLLAEAGFPNGLDLELSVQNAVQSWITAGEQAAAQLLEAGVRAKIRLVDNVQFADAILVRNEYQIYLGPATPLGTTNADLLLRFHSKGGKLGQTLDDPKLDQMIEQQGTMKDVEQRRKALLEIQRYLLNEAVPSAVIDARLSTDVVQANVRDYTLGLPNPAYDEWTYLWLDS